MDGAKVFKASFATAHQVIREDNPTVDGPIKPDDIVREERPPREHRADIALMPTFSEVAGNVLSDAARGISEAVDDYVKMKQENGELKGIIMALSKENEWLRSMINKVVK